MNNVETTLLQHHPIRAWLYKSQLPSKRTGNQFVEKFFGLQVPLEENIYKRAVQELEKSCGQMCVDGLAEFNCGRKLGRGLHQFAQFELVLAAGQQNAVVSEVALVKFGMQLPACSLRPVVRWLP